MKTQETRPDCSYNGLELINTLRGACSNRPDTRAEAPRSLYAAGYVRRLPIQRVKIAAWYYPRIRARVIIAVCALAALTVAGYMAYTVIF
jgi:hypothetical protein